MTKSPLYETIFKDFKHKIKSGVLKPGDKLPTEKEISDLYNVSRITSTRALKELELRHLIRKIKGSGSYVNELHTKSLEDIEIEHPRGHLSLISLVLPFDGVFSSEYLQGIEDVAKEQGYFVTFHNSQKDPSIERQIIEEIIERGSHGIIVYPVSTSENLDLYTGLIIDNFPFVLIDHKIPGIDTSLVWADNQKGLYDMTTHLIELGHKRIAFIGQDVYGISSEFERYRGFCRAHIDNGLILMPQHLYTEASSIKVPGDYLPDLPLAKREVCYLYDVLNALPKDQRPTALVAVNDEVADILIACAVLKGIDIPNEYSVTGFDNLPFASHLTPPLTTVTQPTRRIGREAAHALFKTILEPDRKPEVVAIPSELILRESTSKPRSS